MHAHADWLGQIAKIRTNYNADHFKKAVMHKIVRFPMSTPSGKLLARLSRLRDVSWTKFHDRLLLYRLFCAIFGNLDVSTFYCLCVELLSIAKPLIDGLLWKCSLLPALVCMHR
jgi:hypothetical protein